MDNSNDEGPYIVRNIRGEFGAFDEEISYDHTAISWHDSLGNLCIDHFTHVCIPTPTEIEK